ncbi:AAA family ATPase [Paraliomyxa miuraensis]|uniref:AAA family ATPase n=1 Tax=Paraliomyxa miuraensis TaxID=376150 RepID=UPI0022583EEC|nr:AAA family ATPase [Paraliomyxa miuraensis]MCX4246100.1 AAA family ATPase [Paraliomyxa miuraensis]
MFLRRLEIENVRGFRRASLNFVDSDVVRPWTLLLGVNGVGKSTLLRAIALATTGSDALTDLIGLPHEWVRNGAKRAVIRAELQNTAPDATPFVVELEIHRDDTIRRVLDRNEESLAYLDGIIADQGWLPTVGYGVSRRASAEALRARSRTGIVQPRASAVATLFSPFEELVSIESWAMDLDYRRGAQALSLIRHALESILMPGVGFVDIDKDQRELIFRTEDGDLPFSQLSDGFQSVVAWVGDLLFRLTDTFEIAKRPLEAPGLLLLDEIELHLHPQWQRRLIEYLRQLLPNFQFVATTHSPLTAQQVDEGELYAIERSSDDGPQIVPFAGEPRKLFIHQLLADPIFGIPMSSQYVENARARLHELRKKRRLAASERDELARLEAELDSMPEWTRDEAPERRTQLLARIEARLAELSEVNEVTKKKKKKATKKSTRSRR